MPLPPQHNTVPFYYHHVPKNILLILLSLLCFPVTATLILTSLLSSKLGGLSPKKSQHSSQEYGQNGKEEASPSPKTILVTGVSMNKGLSVARLLSQHTPHCIIGADIESTPYTSPGRYSHSLSSFHALTPPSPDSADPYIESLLQVIRTQNVDLWISCSSVISAVEDGEVMRRVEERREWKQDGDARPFHAVQFSEDVVAELHSKDRFLDFVKGMGEVLPVTYRCEDADSVLNFLDEGRKNGGGETDSEKNRMRKGDKKNMRFILKPIGVDDRARGNMMTLLPLDSLKETAEYVSTLGMSKANPYILQQYISGPEYCTHALVIRGCVKAFVACPSSDLLMHYEALDPSSPLSQEMLRFTEEVASEKGENFTGHLSFDFLAEDDGEKSQLYPIECNPRAHTAVVLFQDEPKMAERYLEIFEGDDARTARAKQDVLVPQMPCSSYYWVGHDFVTSLVTPLLGLLCGQVGAGDLKKGVVELWTHLRYWKDGTFVAWDPVPFLVLYHVYWPMRFLECIFQGKEWSR